MLLAKFADPIRVANTYIQHEACISSSVSCMLYAVIGLPKCKREFISYLKTFLEKDTYLFEPLGTHQCFDYFSCFPH